MPTVIPVKFKYAARDLWFDPVQSGAQEGDHVICSTERGEEIGLVTMDAQEMDAARLRSTIGDATLKPVLRVADDADLDRAERLAERGEEAFPTFRRLVAEGRLDMKPVGVEYLFGGSKVVCYFSAEERVDFRQLVRDLSRELHERIDMRQIGVREEAAIIGGYAHCGQELCCARFGRQFEPVSIRMAKEQDLPLNSTKISGACGRLMCCLRYEFDAYRDFKGRAPKRNAVIDTPLGKGKIVEYDTPKERITMRLENGKVLRVALSDMQASEAAVKKSEELGCPCRPDTVTREALDKLDSPEVRMALAELDRKMGVLPAQTYDESDIFVESRPRRRRRSGSGEGRRRGGETQEAAAGSGRSRRRRRKSQQDGQNAGATQQEQTTRQSSGRRRRRHHVGASSGEQAEQQQSKTQERPRGMQPSKAKRRPGDRGGAAAQADANQGAQQRSSKSKHQTSTQGQRQGGAQAQGESKPRRRRRHRGGRGRGKGGSPDTSGTTPAPSAD